MKRVISIVLMIIMAFSLVSCSKETQSDPKPLPNDKEQTVENNKKDEESELKSDYKILNPNKKQQTSDLTAVDINTNTLIKNTTTNDLKDKTITFYISSENDDFKYKKDNTFLGEKNFFKSLKENFGLDIAYKTVVDKNLLTSQIIAMKAGKKIDLVRVSLNQLAQSYAISSSIEDFVDESKLNTGNHINKAIFNNTKIDKKPYFLAPAGVGDYLWYNKNLVESVKTDDPAEIFQDGKWNFTSFENFCKSMSDKNRFVFKMNGSFIKFNMGAAQKVFTLDNESKIVNNISSKDISKTFSYYSKLAKTYSNVFVSATSKIQKDKTPSFSDKNVVMTSGRLPMSVNDKSGFSLGVVPYPSVGKGGQNAVGATEFIFALPKKTTKNANIALKFAELWCAKYSESYFDLLKFQFGLSNNDCIRLYNASQKLSYATACNADNVLSENGFEKVFSDGPIKLDECLNLLSGKLDAYIKEINNGL